MTVDKIEQRVGFLGAGRMATALAKGLCGSGIVSPTQIVAHDVVPAAVESFVSATGASGVASNGDVLNVADVVFLAVKPQHMPDVLAEIGPQLTDQHLLVSIAAGVSIETMTTLLGENVRIVRVMPNTPALVGQGASAYAMGGAATTEDGALVERLLETIGIAVAVPESLLDAVTGLSGSGPAYVYQVIESLSDGGVRMGLPRDIATRLAAQTVLGAAQMVLETGEHPGALKDAVTSPGGTTIAGLHALEQGGLRGCLMNAVEAATLRSQQLGQSS
jgi:pyrroline-5-carboxylate reductase